MMNGGYLMVSKTDTKLYEKLNNALTLGKPVLFYEDENTCYYIDTITKSGTDIILTKGGMTITIENDGDITESGNIQPKKTYRHIVNCFLTYDSIAKKGSNVNIIIYNDNDTSINTLDLLKQNLSTDKYNECIGIVTLGNVDYSVSLVMLDPFGEMMGSVVSLNGSHDIDDTKNIYSAISESTFTDTIE